MSALSLVERLTSWVHQLPHVNYRFKLIQDSFNLDVNGAYVQSLVVFCGISLLLALLFLLVIVVTWICQCCLKKSDNVHSRRHIRRLSTALFIISVICFALLGVCLYGNEHVNKSVNSAITGLSDFTQNVRVSIDQAQRLNSTQFTAAAHIDELTSLIERKAKEQPHINQTLLREVDTLLTEVSDRVDEVKGELAKAGDVLMGVKFLERSKLYGNRIEFERWILCLVLLCIMVAVLFIGVIAFCRQSRKGAIIFSGLGIVIFLLTWIMFSLVFPLTVAYADFCADGQTFLHTRLNSELLESLEFYRDCQPRSISQDKLPPKIPVARINDLYVNIQLTQQKLEGLLFSLFNRSQEIEEVSREFATDIAQSFKAIGALESALSCYSLHDDVQGMYKGFCTDGFLGSIIVAAALFKLGFFLFILLIVVSRSWHIFVRLPSDYTEVGDDDHFSPRGQDAMPDNVYDTNIFNPRARNLGMVNDAQLYSTPEDEESVQRRSLGGTVGGLALADFQHVNGQSAMGNGHHPGIRHSTNSSGGAPLLLDPSNRDGGWALRGNGPSAPPANNTLSLRNGGTSSARTSSSNFQLNNPYRQYQQLNQDFQEQFDI